MKDTAGNKLEVGQHVWANDGGYAELVRWVVVGFTPKQVRLVRDDGDKIYDRSNRSGSVTWNKTTPTLKSPLRVIRALGSTDTQDDTVDGDQ